jgi:hypothetical protein
MDPLDGFYHAVETLRNAASSSGVRNPAAATAAPRRRLDLSTKDGFRFAFVSLAPST